MIATAPPTLNDDWKRDTRSPRLLTNDYETGVQVWRAERQLMSGEFIWHVLLEGWTETRTFTVPGCPTCQGQNVIVVKGREQQCPGPCGATLRWGPEVQGYPTDHEPGPCFECSLILPPPGCSQPEKKAAAAARAARLAVGGPILRNGRTHTGFRGRKNVVKA